MRNDRYVTAVMTESKSKRPPGGIARRITKARRARSLSMAELAKRAGVDPSWVSRVESGEIEEPAPGRLQKIADVLGVSLVTILEAPIDPADDDELLRRLIERRVGDRANAAMVEAILDKLRDAPSVDRNTVLSVVDTLLRNLAR